MPTSTRTWPRIIPGQARTMCVELAHSATIPVDAQMCKDQWTDAWAKRFVQASSNTNHCHFSWSQYSRQASDWWNCKRILFGRELPQPFMEQHTCMQAKNILHEQFWVWFWFKLTGLRTCLCAIWRREHETQIGARLLVLSYDRPKSILFCPGIVAIDLLPLEPGDCNEKAFPLCRCRRRLDQL